MFSDEIPNKRAPRFKTCLDDSEWFAGRSFLKIRYAIYWIHLYPVDNAVGIHNTYPLDNDLSGLLRRRKFEQLGPEL